MKFMSKSASRGWIYRQKRQESGPLWISLDRNSTNFANIQLIYIIFLGISHFLALTWLVVGIFNAHNGIMH